MELLNINEVKVYKPNTDVHIKTEKKNKTRNMQNR